MVSLTRREWLEVEMALAAHLSELDKDARLGIAPTKRRRAAESAFKAIGRAQGEPSPEQGEHVAQSQQGECPHPKASQMARPDGKVSCGVCGVRR